MSYYSKVVREPRWHYRLDKLSGAILFVMVIVSPWAFGGWPWWSVWAMNVGGALAGAAYLLKLGLRRRSGFEPMRWGGRKPVVIRYGLGVVTVLILLWCLVAAVNAQSVVDLEKLRLVERSGWIGWLPHSYDQPATWSLFWQYLGVAGVFWALLDWLTIASSGERRLLSEGQSGRKHAWSRHRVPRRLRALLWVLSLNGGMLALAGIVSTIDDPSKVLWLMPHEEREGGFFGPFYYRNHGAQYLNLVWPLGLGLWLTHSLRAVGKKSVGTVIDWVLVLALGFSLLMMIAAPFISSSRGGSVTAVLLLAASLPVVFVVGVQTRRVVVLLVVGITLLGGGLGIRLAWEPLKQRFFRDIVVYPTGVQADLDEFTLRAKIRVPSVWGREPATYAGLSDSSGWLWNTAGSMALSLRRRGVFEARFVESDRTHVLTLVARSALLADGGRTVELIFTHRAGESALYLNGERLELEEVRSRAGFEWPARRASRYLWVGRGAGGSMEFKERIDAVTLLDVALPEALIERVAERDPQPSRLIDVSLWNDRWAGLEREPLVDVGPSTLSPKQWLATGLGGRGEIYALSREMMEEHPRMLGIGPGAFAGVFKVFRQTRDPAQDWHAHNDHLETRITFGLVGAGVIWVGVLLCVVGAMWRGGLPVPWYCVALAVVALAGGLFHARYDWVFQMHALLFLGVTLCGILASVSIGSVARDD
jgi:hypothetical protein